MVDSIKIRFTYTYLLFILILSFTSFYREAFVFTFSILLHELMHILFAYFFGVRKFDLEITLFGGIAHFDNYQFNKQQKLIVLLSGIMGNILLCIVNYLLLFFSILTDVSSLFIKYNLLMIVFSILPIYPLDGFKILEIFLKKEKIKKCSWIALSILLIFSVYNKCGYLIIISLFLGFKNIKYEEDKKREKLFNYFNCFKKSLGV